MTENKISFAINANQVKKGPPQIEGMIALKRIQNYSYALTDQIGLGFSSHVYKGKNELTNEVVAIKVIDLKKQDQLSKQFANEEIAILEAIKLKNTVNLLHLYDVFKTKNNLYIITEFCEGKDIAKLLRKKKKLTEGEAQSILKQLMVAYRELYELAIVHRDLKLANVFVRQGVIILADFGFAISSEMCNRNFDYNVGSPYYMPPQTLKFNTYSFKSDVWSMGVIAYEMVYGKLPWKEKVQSLLFEKITSTPIEQLFDHDVPLSDHYKNFIVACLQISYDKRATPEYIINYQWPLAQDYVFGVEPEGPQKPPPISVVKVAQPNNAPNSAKGLVSSHSIQEQSKRIKTQHEVMVQPIKPSGDRSPTHRINRKLSNPYDELLKERHFFHDINPRQNDINPRQNEPIPEQISKITQNSNEQQNISNAEVSILNQIHYNRFMAQLIDILDSNNILPDGYLLRNQIAAKILGKYELLMRLVQGDNALGIQGFAQYKNTERWSKLKTIIQTYDIKYKDKLEVEVQVESNELLLINSIKYLRANLQVNFTLLQELTYLYQLRQLERRLSPIQFALTSKLQFLCNRKANSSFDSNFALLCQRLGSKLNLLGL